METQARYLSTAPPLGRIETIVNRLIPPARREDLWGDLEHHRHSTAEFLKKAFQLTTDTIASQAREAFKGGLLAAETGAVYLSFLSLGIAGLSAPMVVAALAALGTLIVRDTWRYRIAASPVSAVFDAALAAVFVLGSVSLLGRLAPAAAVPSGELLKGAAISLLLLSIVRMLVRVPIVPRKPEDPSKALHRGLRWINCFWMTAALALIATNSEAVPDTVPGGDFLVVFVPIIVSGFAWRAQRDNPKLPEYQVVVLGRRLTLAEQSRKRAALWMPSEPEPKTWLGVDGSVFAESLLFVLMALPLVLALAGGLLGAPGMDWLRVGVNLGAFAALTGLWMHIRRRNRAAARSLDAAIRASGAMG